MDALDRAVEKTRDQLAAILEDHARVQRAITTEAHPANIIRLAETVNAVQDRLAAIEKRMVDFENRIISALNASRDAYRAMRATLNEKTTDGAAGDEYNSGQMNTSEATDG